MLRRSKRCDPSPNALSVTLPSCETASHLRAKVRAAMRYAIGAGLRSCEPSKLLSYDAFPARCGLAGAAAGDEFGVETCRLFYNLNQKTVPSLFAPPNVVVP
jgi:hypothetical protein